EAEYSNAFKGAYTEWYPNGQKKYEGQMRDGVQNGIWLTYHENGALKARQTYLYGILIGAEKFYSEQGQLTDSSFYRGGMRSGKRITWSNSGAIRSETLYEKGSLTGLQRYYYASGALHYEELCNDSICSVVSCRDSLGQVLLENGSGIFRTYHPNGQVASESGYVEGVQQSIQRWDPQGQLRFQAQYKADIIRSFSVFDSVGRALWSCESKFFNEKDSILIWRVNQYRPADSLDAVHDVFSPYPFLEAEPKPMNMDEIRTKVGYPKVARDLGIQGNVIAWVLVEPDGKVAAARVVSTYIPLLEEQVLDHIYKLRFDPGIQQGEATRFWVNIPFSFKLL
ncbi:MAG: TonB family protein, partial [Bacteroidetes bacterium]